MLEQGGGRIVTISMSETTMVRRGFVPYGPSGAAVEALSRVMAADLADTTVTANLLLPGGATDTGMIPDDTPPDARARLLDPAIMGPPIVWLASPAGAGVHDERIVAAEFEEWLARGDGTRGLRACESVRLAPGAGVPVEDAIAVPGRFWLLGAAGAAVQEEVGPVGLLGERELVVDVGGGVGVFAADHQDEIDVGDAFAGFVRASRRRPRGSTSRPPRRGTCSPRPDRADES